MSVVCERSLAPHMYWASLRMMRKNVQWCAVPHWSVPSDSWEEWFVCTLVWGCVVIIMEMAIYQRICGACTVTLLNIGINSEPSMNVLGRP